MMNFNKQLCIDWSHTGTESRIVYIPQLNSAVSNFILLTLQAVHAVPTSGRHGGRRPSCRRNPRHVDSSGARSRDQRHVRRPAVVPQPLRPQLRRAARRRRTRRLSQPAVREDPQCRSEPFRCCATLQRLLARGTRPGENCGRSQPRPTGSRAVTRPGLSWLRPIRAHSVKMHFKPRRGQSSLSNHVYTCTVMK